MKVQYGDACLSLQQVYEWTRKFTNGISSVTDSPRPGQAHPVVTPENTAAVEAIVKENRRVTVNEIAAHLDMSHGSAHHFVHEINKLYLRFSDHLCGLVVRVSGYRYRGSGFDPRRTKFSE